MFTNMLYIYACTSTHLASSIYDCVMSNDCMYSTQVLREMFMEIQQTLSIRQYGAGHV